MDRTKGTFYDHNEQKQKIGVSSLKIFDGEDLRANCRSLRQQQDVQGTTEAEDNGSKALGDRCVACAGPWCVPC